MGYLTVFNITYSDKTEEIRKYAEKLSDDNIMNNDNGFYYNDGDFVKWHNYQRDMLYLSKEFSDVLITVKGEGEEDNDRWIQFFKGGKCTNQKMATITIIYDEFNDNDLIIK